MQKIIWTIVETNIEIDEEWKEVERQVIKPAEEIIFSKISSLEFKDWNFLVTYKE